MRGLLEGKKRRLGKKKGDYCVRRPLFLPVVCHRNFSKRPCTLSPSLITIPTTTTTLTLSLSLSSSHTTIRASRHIHQTTTTTECTKWLEGNYYRMLARPSTHPHTTHPVLGQTSFGRRGNSKSASRQGRALLKHNAPLLHCECRMYVCFVPVLLMLLLLGVQSARRNRG
ncbi:hypothetical protein BD289DRAFT_130099 [Coniella lustricola]|uniref:Uncharacterized protein n=1 Tax=Coniella lustricola TaxID=2025994 RepID=A0A2T3AFP9_9PEZI|nr:hypothetical protein BD289DRAFT_130099 [Coniella lustricola]